MYAQMVIGEVIHADCDMLGEFRCIYKAEVEPELMKQDGCFTPALLLEEGGRMVIVITMWDTSEHCVQYHASKAYRQFVAKTQHLLIGDFVLKCFRME